MADHSPDSSLSISSSQALDGLEQTWHTVAESLGTTATAALMRRAAKRASAHTPALSGFQVRGAGYTYRYEVPAAWRTAGHDTCEQVRALLGELCALLGELTGEVITSRLASNSAIRPLLPADDAQRKNRDASSH